MLKKSIQYILDLFYPMFKKVMSFEVYAYLAVGAANTALNILLFALFHQFVLSHSGVTLFGVHIESYTISLIIAFVTTVPTGFWLSKHFAFNRNQTGGNTPKQLGKYFLVVLQGLGSDYLLLVALIVIAGFHPTVAKLSSTVIVLTLNFLLQKYFTFRVKTV